MNKIISDEKIKEAAISVYEGLDEEKGYIRARPYDYVRAGAKFQRDSDAEYIEELKKEWLSVFDGARNNAVEEIRKHLNLLLKHNPLHGVSLRKELGKYIESLEKEGE